MPHEYDIISRIGVSLFAIMYEKTTNRKQRILETFALLTSSRFFRIFGLMKSMVSVVVAVIVIEERVETDAAIKRTRITPTRTSEISDIFSIFGIR